MSYLSFINGDVQNEAISHYDFLQLIDGMSQKSFEDFFICILEVLMRVKFQRSQLSSNKFLLQRLSLLIGSCKEERVVLIAALMYYERMLAYQLFSEAAYYTLAPMIAALSLGCKMYGATTLHLKDACAVADTGITPQTIVKYEIALMNSMKNNLTLKGKKFYHFLYLALKNANISVPELRAGKVSLKFLEMASFFDVGDTEGCDILATNAPVTIYNSV